MWKFDGKVLPQGVAAIAALICAHAALAAGPSTPQDRAPVATQVTTAHAAPAVLSLDTNPSSEPILPTPPAPTDSVDVAASLQVDPKEVECIAKVIRHEAANQPVAGQVAVAKVVRARTRDGRFPKTVCAVVKQRGQFFDIDAYDPPRDDVRWTTATRVAAHVLAEDETVAQGDALFFRSGGTPMSGRIRVMRIADHTFYR